MGRVLLLLLVVAFSRVAAAQPAGPSLESKVAAALAEQLRARIGASAVVSVDRVDVSVRRGEYGSVSVVPAPRARYGEPVEFGVVGAGASGRASFIGRGRATVRVVVPHATVSRTLPRGTVLAEDDMRDVLGTPEAIALGPMPTRSALVGAVLKRDLAEDDVLTFQGVTLPLAVHAGDLVQARATIGTVSVTGELTALESGAEGAIVRVVNRESRKALRARVIQPGVVEVIHE